MTADSFQSIAVNSHAHLAINKCPSPKKSGDQSKVAFRSFRGKVNRQLDIYADGVTPPEKIVDMGLRGLIPEWKTNEYRTPNFEHRISKWGSGLNVH